MVGTDAVVFINLEGERWLSIGWFFFLLYSMKWGHHLGMSGDEGVTGSIRRERDVWNSYMRREEIKSNREHCRLDGQYKYSLIGKWFCQLGEQRCSIAWIYQC